jgi:hypothetical protein
MAKVANPYVVVIQRDLLEALPTRLTVPLAVLWRTMRRRRRRELCADRWAT